MSNRGDLINGEDFDCEEAGDNQDSESMYVVYRSQPDTGTSDFTSAYHEDKSVPVRNVAFYVSMSALSQV